MKLDEVSQRNLPPKETDVIMVPLAKATNDGFSLLDETETLETLQNVAAVLATNKRLRVLFQVTVPVAVSEYAAWGVGQDTESVPYLAIAVQSVSFGSQDT